MYLEDGALTGKGGHFVVVGLSTPSHLVFSADNFAQAFTTTATNTPGSDLTIDGGFVSAGDSATLDASQFKSTASTAGDIAFGGTKGGNLYAKAMAAIGTTDTSWLAGQVNAATNGAGLTQTGVTAALGINTAQVLGAGYGIEVDGSKTTATLAPAANTLTFANNSLLVVSSVAATSANGAISAAAPATATIADSAKLRIADALVGQSYKVLDPTTITTTMCAIFSFLVRK